MSEEGLPKMGAGSFADPDSSVITPASGARRRRGSSDDEDGSAYKRQRTALACNSCRARKSRCNGERPLCSSCADMGFECVYRRPAPVSKTKTREMASMENRLKMVEDLLRSMVGREQQPVDTTQFPSDRDSQIGHLPSNGDLLLSNGAPGRGEKSRSEGETGPQSALPMSEEDTVDGMGIITFADETTSGHFGPSSNSAFFGHITRILASGTASSSRGRENPRYLAANLSRPPSPQLPSNRRMTEPTNPYILPPREEILELVEVFFSLSGIFFPFIHKRKIIGMIEELDVVRFTGVRKSWLCLLNAILAIGTSLKSEKGKPPRFREAESDVFFQRALILSPWTISNTANLETLQAVAVMTQYLQGSSKSAQAWRLHGLLVQAAFQMGVHTRDTSGKYSPLEQEIRTRVWYTCVVLDRMFSMTFGRPPLVHNEYIQLDPPLDIELDDIPNDDDVRVSFELKSSEPSSSALFISSIKLYLILGDVIRDIYKHNVVSSKVVHPNELFSNIMKLDHELTEWKRTLHPAVAILSPQDFSRLEPQNWAYNRTQTVLTLRYLSVRLVLYRKVLEKALDDASNQRSANDDLDYSPPIAQAMLQICVDSAITMIKLVGVAAPRTDMLPAWWFTAYYVFNAALIVFGVVCVQTIGKIEVGTHTPAQLVQWLQTALENLEVVGKETRIVRRCSKYLKKMIQISSSLTRNSSSSRAQTVGPATDLPSAQYENPPSTTDDSTRSPVEAEFGQFLIDDDFNFLDLWTDLAAQPSTN